MIQSAVHSFESSKSWEGFVASQRRSAADISCRVRELQHPARNFLDRLRKHGVPVVMSTGSWSLDRKDAAVQRGPHQSAKLELEFVREEFLDFMLKGFWTILPYRLVRHIKSLRLSPLGVVPQRDRRPRLIVDLSFYGINGECVPIAPSEAMQFGRALQRILQRVLLADPIYGPVYVSKIDISDGFYRIHLAPRDTLKLGVLLPRAAGEEPMVAIPLVLPMGWIHSPPYFSAVTETAADVMNRRLKSNQDLPKHRLEDLALHPPPPDDAPTNSVTSPSPHSAPAVPTSAAPQHIIHAPEYRRPMKFVDIYVDDFLGLVQGDQLEWRRAMRTTLHVLDEVL